MKLKRLKQVTQVQTEINMEKLQEFIKDFQKLVPTAELSVIRSDGYGCLYSSELSGWYDICEKEDRVFIESEYEGKKVITKNKNLTPEKAIVFLDCLLGESWR